METAFHTSQRLGEIVAAFPGASNVFKAHGIDFCCGGGRTLGEALQAGDVPEQPILEELHRAFDEARSRQDATGTDWSVAPLSSLIDRIVTAHHGYLKRELPVLSGFVTKIHQVHGSRHPELATLDHVFHELKADMEPHMVSEETGLFPLVQTYERTGNQADLERAVATLDELEAEHQAAGRLLASMRETTHGYLVPADACETYKLTLLKLADLESDMFDHVHLENNILFERLQGAARAVR